MFNDQKKDLKAFYPFSGNANDISGNDNHGIPKGGAELVENRFGEENSAYRFDGENARIEIKNSPSLQIGTKDYSIIAWIKADDVQENQGLGRIFSQGSWSCGNENGGHKGYMLRLNRDYTVESENSSNGCVQVTSNIALTDGNWHMVATTVDRDGKIKVYIDGVLDSEKDSNNNASFANGLDVMIGHSNLPEDHQESAFKGAIDDIKIVARVLAEEEIQAEYVSDGTADDPCFVDLTGEGVINNFEKISLNDGCDKVFGSKGTGHHIFMKGGNDYYVSRGGSNYVNGGDGVDTYDLSKLTVDEVVINAQEGTASLDVLGSESFDSFEVFKLPKNSINTFIASSTTLKVVCGDLNNTIFLSENFDPVLICSNGNNTISYLGDQNIVLDLDSGEMN